MYESHFDLKKRPFRALALGNDVFIGPQSAATINAIKKGLASPDAIAAVSGPVGGGKTTLVGRALQSVGERHATIAIGRIQLGHDEVLELLLEEMGVDPLPAGTVQRFTLFRRLLKKAADRSTRVIVTAEDAARIGIDALSELEALTAADAGVSNGANVVLMGDEELDALLAAPRLARLKQRLRLRHTVKPLDANELLAYLKHGFRLAGGDFEAVFEPGSAGLLHELSGGIPRMVNNLVDAAMVAAAECDSKTIGTGQIRQVAAEEFGIETRETPAESPPTSVEPVENTDNADEDLPELIHDTLPDLAILPQPPAQPAADSVAPPIVETPGPAVAEPKESVIAASPAAEKPATPTAEIPAWDRDPTLAELRPDLEALEHAMAVAHGTDTETGIEPVLKPEPEVEAVAAETDEPVEIVPEITLDREIQAKIDEAAEAIKRFEAEKRAKAEADAETVDSIDLAASGSAIELPPRPVEKTAPETADAEKPAPAANNGQPGPDTERRRIVRNLASARTIDDVDDRMAETLFGEELNDIAADLASNNGHSANDSPANDSPANVELELVPDETPPAPAPAAEPETAAAVPPPAAKPEVPAADLDEAAEKRLATVRALNSGKRARPSPRPAEPAVSGDRAPLGSIEEQIHTSMTQTLAALGAGGDSDGEDEENGKSGFFGRFRKP